MRINTNIASLNSQRVLGQTNSAAARSIGRLSSGFRINRAADDAAGLGIANKLRSDVRALRQASRNAEQASSVLQIAEGGAQQIQGIVERMKELATQAASDNVDSAARGRIDIEYQDLLSEIGRITASTKFQGNALLNGTFGAKVDTDALVSTLLGAATEVTAVSSSGAAADTYTLTHTANSLSLTNSAGTLTQVVDITGQDAQRTFAFDKFGITVETSADFVAAVASATGDVVVAGTTAEFVVGASGVIADDKIMLTGLDLTTAARGLNLTGTDLLTDGSATAGAEQALARIEVALGSLADAFADIGAKQNRIDYATANVKTAIENVSAAESAIRDADMASEMAEFTKNQILQQAGVAMLAQANTAPQLMLRLLQ